MSAAYTQVFKVLQFSPTLYQNKPIKGCILQSPQFFNDWFNSKHKELKPKMDAKLKMLLKGESKGTELIIQYSIRLTSISIIAMEGIEIEECELTAPAPYLSEALIKDIMAIFKLNSSLWCPVVRSKSFIRVWREKQRDDADEFCDDHNDVSYVQKCTPLDAWWLQ